MQIDLMSISGHKIYGPKGVGALYVRRRPRVRLLPLIDGGGQERGLRSGTLPTPLCVGLGRAAAIAAAEMAAEAARLRQLARPAADESRAPRRGVADQRRHRAPPAGKPELSFPRAPGLKLIEACPSIAISTGSACTSASGRAVLCAARAGAVGRDANSSIRLGLGRFTTAAEVDFAVDALAAAASRLAAESRVAEAGRQTHIGIGIGVRANNIRSALENGGCDGAESRL